MANEPPSNLGAERAVLGAVLLAPAAWTDISLILAVDDFYLPSHREIYSAMLAIDGRKMPVDFVALSDELSARGILRRIEGGDEYLVSLAAGVPTVENVRHYARLVFEKATMRRILRAATEIAARAQAPDLGDYAEFIENAEQAMFQAFTHRQPDTLLAIQGLLTPTMDTMENRRHAPSGIVGIPTGYWKWDESTGGLQNEQFIVVAARPSCGKTSLSRCVAREAVKHDADVLVFSLEESRFDMVEKWLIADAEVNNQLARKGRLTTDEWRKLHRAAIDLQKTNIFIDDASGFENRIGRIRTKLRRWRSRNPTRKGLVILDYLQLAEIEHEDGGRRENRAAEVAKVSRSCKAMAKEIKVPFIALAQLNREVDKDKRPPRLSDLRESGSIEQDADQVLFLHADGTPQEIAANGVVQAILAKNRGGPTGSFQLAWYAQYGKFTNMEPEPQEWLPGAG